MENWNQILRCLLNLVNGKKNRLHAKLERMELEADIAASEANLKVLNSFHEGSEGQPTVQEKDGMNEYVDSYMQEHNVPVDESDSFPVKYTELGAYIHKTPLQRLFSQPPKLDTSEPAPMQDQRAPDH